MGPYLMSITYKTEWVHKSILNISQNIANIAWNNSLIITRACCLSDIELGWTWWGRRPCSLSSHIPKTTWLQEIVTSKNIHKNTRLILMAFNLETETFSWIKVLPNLLSWFHHTEACVKTLRFTVTYYVETSHHHRHFLAER